MSIGRGGGTTCKTLCTRNRFRRRLSGVYYLRADYSLALEQKGRFCREGAKRPRSEWSVKSVLDLPGKMISSFSIFLCEWRNVSDSIYSAAPSSPSPTPRTMPPHTHVCRQIWGIVLYKNSFLCGSVCGESLNGRAVKLGGRRRLVGCSFRYQESTIVKSGKTLFCSTKTIINWNHRLKTNDREAKWNENNLAL